VFIEFVGFLVSKMKIKRFEDLHCWQEARKLVNFVYRTIKESKDFQKDARLCGQITGAAVSSMSNIAEGFSRRSNNEFIQYLFISKSPATEVQSEAYGALDQRYVEEETFNHIYEQAERVSKLDSGLITYLLQNQRSSKPNKLNKHNEPKKPNKHNKPNEPKKLEKPKS